MKLILQGSLRESTIQKIKILTQSNTNTQVADSVWRLDHIINDAQAEIENICLEEQIDVAFLSDKASLNAFKLLSMDMDSTFVQIECIDEMADYYGVKDQVSKITEASMKGELDFNESLQARVSLLKGMPENALPQIFEHRLKLSPGADAMLKTLKQAGIKVLLVSGGFTYFTNRLQQECQLDFVRANTLEIIDGHLTGKTLGTVINAQEKANTVLQTCNVLGIDPSECITMGDGANDLKMMQISGLSVAYHAKPKVRAEANVCLNYCGLDGLTNLFL